MKGWDGCIKHEHREEKNKVLGSMTVNQVTVKKVAQRSIQCVSEWAAEHGGERGQGAGRRTRYAQGGEL